MSLLNTTQHSQPSGEYSAKGNWASQRDSKVVAGYILRGVKEGLPTS